MLWLVEKNQRGREILLFRGSKYLVLIGLIFLASWALAEETGKIAGKVTDAKTGERCPFTFVTILGTKIGANADENGNFVLENIPEGSYDLKADMLGYKSIVKTNVRVIQGQTTNQDFEFSERIYRDHIKIIGPQKKQIVPTGKISGKVTDATNGEGLQNACLEIVGNKLIKLSGTGGKYRINIRPGTYVLCAIKSGFKRSEMVEVDVVKGKTIVKNFRLERDTK